MVNKTIKGLLKKSGMEFHITENGETTEIFMAILQPLRYKNKIYLHGVPTELGYDNLKKYLLISPAEIDFSTLDNVNTSLYLGEVHYSVDHSEKVFFQGKPYYTWSIISKEE